MVGYGVVVDAINIYIVTPNNTCLMVDFYCATTNDHPHKIVSHTEKRRKNTHVRETLGV